MNSQGFQDEFQESTEQVKHEYNDNFIKTDKLLSGNIKDGNKFSPEGRVQMNHVETSDKRLNETKDVLTMNGQKLSTCSKFQKPAELTKIREKIKLEDSESSLPVQKQNISEGMQQDIQVSSPKIKDEITDKSMECDNTILTHDEEGFKEKLQDAIGPIDYEKIKNCDADKIKSDPMDDQGLNEEFKDAIKSINQDSDEKSDEKSPEPVSASTLMIHDKNRGDGKPWVCSICEESFSTEHKLTVHVRRHTGERPFKCEFCPSRFVTNTDLKRHTRRHTGEKPYQCQICQAAFSQTSTLKTHMMTHTGEKPHACPYCDAAFTVTSSLKVHVRIHTGEKSFRCEVCNTMFSQMRNLKQHMNIHTREESYNCSYCGSSFPQRSSLARHIKIHTGEKPHKCYICGYAFIRRHHLRRHLKVHTGDQNGQSESDLIDNLLKQESAASSSKSHKPQLKSTFKFGENAGEIDLPSESDMMNVLLQQEEKSNIGLEGDIMTMDFNNDEKGNLSSRELITNGTDFQIDKKHNEINHKDEPGKLDIKQDPKNNTIHVMDAQTINMPKTGSNVADGETESPIKLNKHLINSKDSS